MASPLLNCFTGSLAVRARSTVNIVEIVTHRHVAGTDTGD